MADPRADFVEPVGTRLDPADRFGQGPPQRLFRGVVLG
jgi:hypothetical protein